MSVKKNSFKQFLKKLLSLFSVVRGYNIITLIIAQYLASIFIFSPQHSLRIVLLNPELFLIVLASVLVVASGYIINDFYDKEKDKINRPVKSKIDNYVSQNTKLRIYFLFNFLSVALVSFISWRAVFFFATYIFLLWFYSHKLKKYPIIGIISATVVMLLPFFAIFVYYKNFSEVIFIHAIFLFCLLIIRELIKNLENMDGDILTNNQSVPIKYGEKITKRIISLFMVLLLIPIYYLLSFPEIGRMKYYFYFAVISLVVFIFSLWNSKSKGSYRNLHNLLKVLIFAGIFSLILIDTSVIIRRILEQI